MKISDIRAMTQDELKTNLLILKPEGELPANTGEENQDRDPSPGPRSTPIEEEYMYTNSQT